MRKIILSLFIICMMSMSVSALVSYTGVPILPYLVYGDVEWNDQMLSGTRLELTNQNTGFTKTITTDSNGYWQEDAGNWKTVSSNRPPIMYGDVISIKALDGCGTGDICTKTFTAYGTNYENSAIINIELTGTLVCAPLSCPACSSCNCNGGSGVIYKATQELCDKDYPCEVTEKIIYKYLPCNEKPCTDVICEDKVCDDCEVCSIIEGEESNNGGILINISIAILFAIIGIVSGIYIKGKEEN